MKHFNATVTTTKAWKGVLGDNPWNAQVHMFVSAKSKAAAVRQMNAAYPTGGNLSISWFNNYASEGSGYVVEPWLDLYPGSVIITTAQGGRPEPWMVLTGDGERVLEKLT